jgi:flavin reductase (DIM6/NTAB) family NADH-FMN oxidoreductase RutF
METREVDLTCGLPETVQVLREPGLLLTSADSEGRPNVMTIGWGNPGVIWGRPIFVVYVRPSRFTFQNIEGTGEFVVNVPTADMQDQCMYCGTESGRDINKFEQCGLTPVDAPTVRAPLIAECVRFYECKVVHVNDLVDAAIAADIRREAYPKGDFHRLYFGQVMRVSERV